jgi:hypothetical protein
MTYLGLLHHGEKDDPEEHGDEGIDDNETRIGKVSLVVGVWDKDTLYLLCENSVGWDDSFITNEFEKFAHQKVTKIKSYWTWDEDLIELGKEQLEVQKQIQEVFGEWEGVFHKRILDLSTTRGRETEIPSGEIDFRYDQDYWCGEDGTLRSEDEWYDHFRGGEMPLTVTRGIIRSAAPGDGVFRSAAPGDSGFRI